MEYKVGVVTFSCNSSFLFDGIIDTKDGQPCQQKSILNNVFAGGFGITFFC